MVPCLHHKSPPQTGPFAVSRIRPEWSTEAEFISPPRPRAEACCQGWGEEACIAASSVARGRHCVTWPPRCATGAQKYIGTSDIAMTSEDAAQGMTSVHRAVHGVRQGVCLQGHDVVSIGGWLCGSDV